MCSLNMESISHTDINSLRAELKRANELKREADLRADASQRALQLKTMALARMSHDIRTPLHGVVGMAGLLRTTPLNQEQLEFVETIQSSSLFLLGLLRDVLDHSKIEAGKIDLEASPINVTKVVEECARTLTFEASTKNIDIIIKTNYTSGSDSCADIYHIGDTLRLKQIVLNYLSNAIKFSNERGEIVIDVLISSAVDSASGMYDDIKLQVSDSGIGIADPSKLFKPFTQASASTSRQYGGCGLGLNIARTLTELMNGEVGISSELGRGTTIWSTVRLARVPILALSETKDCGMTAPSPHFSSPESVASRLSPETTVDLEDEDRSCHGCEGEDIGWRAKCRILVAEDNVVNQKVLAHMLKRLGYKNIVLTDNGVQAVEEIRRSWTDARGHLYSIVLMDCLMPIMDGQDASRAIRAMESQFTVENAGGSCRTHVPIVALTANALNSDKELCLSSGMDDFVTKPIDMCRLDEIISKWAEPRNTLLLESIDDGQHMIV